jgi:hypothetical protein
MIAAVVIRIGRSRVREASMIASCSGRPCAQHVRVVDLQDRVLLDDPEEQQDPQRAPQIQRPAGRPDGEEGERHRHRQREHDDDRLDEALELRTRLAILRDEDIDPALVEARAAVRQLLAGMIKPG